MAGANFHEDQVFTVASDDVDLPELAPEVPLHDRISMPGKIVYGRVFGLTAFAQPMVLGWLLRFSAEHYLL
jgi:hypothetical protein